VIVVGLTGSIGMGKTTVAAMFREAGAEVWSADEAVHRLYLEGGDAAGPVGALFPEAIADGAIDRDRLAAIVLRDAGALARLEAIVHPLVAADRARFLQDARARGAPLAVLDIPLLFETGGERAFDAVVVVSAPAEVQRARVLARPGMTAEKFAAILARQSPDEEKRARADYVIATGGPLAETRRSVRRAVKDLRRRFAGG
jgi:dephospho-CoA kinase